VSKRLTKQEIREDRVLVAATQAAQAVKKNARLVLAGVAVVVVAIIVAALIAQGRVRATREASSAMSAAETAYFNGNFAQAASQFRSVADRFGSAKSARLARLFEGNAQLASGNAAAAEEAYRKFLSKRNLDPMSLSAAYRGLGGGLDAQQKFAEAGAAFEQAAKVQGNLMAAEDWYQAARAYDQAGQKADADRAYREVVDNYAQTPVAQEARVRRQENLAR